MQNVHEKSIEKTIYLVRHGQSEANITPVFQSTDSPLSDKGIQQAKHIAERVSKLSFPVIFFSKFRKFF